MADFRTYPRRLALAMERTIERAMTEVQTRASANLVNPGGDSLPILPDKLTTRSGRLNRAILGARTRSGESAEYSKRIAVESARVVGLWELKVPYAAIHEYGGTRPAYTIVSTRATIPATKFPERKYIRPAVEEVQKRISTIAGEEIRKVTA